MVCVLGQHDDTGRREQAIYTLAKKWTEASCFFLTIREDLSRFSLGYSTPLTLLSYLVLLLARMDPLQSVSTLSITTHGSGRIARWKMLLSEFAITYVTHKSMLGQERITSPYTSPLTMLRAAHDGFSG